MENNNIIVKVRGIIMYEGKLLIVKHKQSQFMALPGGHLEYGEDVVTCLKRELAEELGVAPEVGNILYISTFIDSKKEQYLEFFFEVKNGKEYLNIDGLERTHAHELAEILWISPTDNIEILPKDLDKDFKENNIDLTKTKFISELNLSN